MILDYHSRLLCLCLASFFAVQLVLSAPVWLLSRALVRRAPSLPARRAAGWALTLRLLPAMLGALVSACVCAPIYLFLEAEPGMERVGTAFLAASLLGAAILAEGLGRTVLAVARSRRFIRKFESAVYRVVLAGATAWVIDSSSPLIFVAGLFRPRLAISRPVLAALSPEQIEMAMRHEQAHGSRHDNLRQLLLVLAPRPLPFWSPYHSLERAWAKFSEWAADDRAVNGDPRRSLALAETLVCVARLGAANAAAPLCTFLLPDPWNLDARVERLLRDAPPEKDDRTPIWTAVGVAAGFLFLASLVRPASLETVQSVLERLVQ